MRLSCLTKTIINEGDEVRFMILMDDTTHLNYEIMSTYKTDDVFKIIGIPFKATLSNRGFCEVENSKESELTLEILKNHMNEDSLEKISSEIDDKNSIWEIIQRKIFDKELEFNGRLKRGFYQIALIDEDVYQMCLKQEIPSYFGKNYNDFSSKIKEELLKTNEKLSLILKGKRDSLNLDSSKDDETKDDLMVFYKEGYLSSCIGDLEFTFNIFFKSGTLNKAILKNEVDQIIESVYVLRILEENGYHLIPLNTISDITNQTLFTKTLLLEQMMDLEREDVDDFIEFPTSKYYVEQEKLKNHLIDFFDEDMVNDLLLRVKLGDEIKIGDDDELSEYVFESLPEYIKTLTVIGSKNDLTSVEINKESE